MPVDKRIDVISYSGYRGEERPRTFILDGWKVDVVEIVKEWTEEDVRKRERKHFFTVKGHDRIEHTLYYDEETSEWFYRSRRRH